MTSMCEATTRALPGAAVIELQAKLAGFGENVSSAGQLGDEHARFVPDHARVDVLV